MSESLFVCLSEESLPSIEQLRSGAQKRGLILEAWDESTLIDIAGFWPATYQNEEAGCEFYCDDTDYDWLNEAGLNDSLLSTKKMMCELSFAGDPSDLLSAAIIVDYLCTECSGSVYSEDDEVFLSGDAATQWAKGLQKEALEMMRDES